MRHSPVELVSNDKGVIGLLLRADYCAEHEWGVAKLKELCDIDSDLIGLDGRTGFPGSFASGPDWFWISQSWRSEPMTKALLKEMNDLQGSADCEARAGWDEGSCGLWLGKKASPELKKMVRLIHEALEAKEKLVICLGGRTNPFGGGGLAISTRGLIDTDPSINQMMTKGDNDRNKLQAVWKPVLQHLEKLLKTPTLGEAQKEFYSTTQYYSIEQVEKNGLSFFSMSPRELRDAPVEGSKYPFLVWLNPSDQKIYNSGWFTVEQLEDWAKGYGRVIEGSKFHHNWMAKKAILKGEKAYPYDYSAICSKCGFEHYDGNAMGRYEMLNKHGRDQHGYDRLVNCPKCGTLGKDFVFSDDNPEHYTNKRK